METTVLVAGGMTPVGGAVVREFERRGHSVRATAAPSQQERAIPPAGREVAWFTVDWSKPQEADEAVDELFRGARIVVDATGAGWGAGRNLDATLRRGVSATRHLMDMADRHRVGRVVHVADAMVLGAGTESVGETSIDESLVSEDDNYVPGDWRWPPVEAAYAAQMEVYRFVQRGLPAAIALPGVVLDPESVQGPVVRLLDVLWRGRLPAVSRTEFNIVDARDVAASIAEMVTGVRTGRRFVLGGENMSLGAFIETAAEVADVSAPERAIPSSWVDESTAAADRVLGRLPGWLGGRRRRQIVEGWITELRRLVRAGPLSNDRAVNELGHRVRPIRRTLSEAFEQWNQHRSSV